MTLPLVTNAQKETYAQRLRRSRQKAKYQAKYLVVRRELKARLLAGDTPAMLCEAFPNHSRMIRYLALPKPDKHVPAPVVSVPAGLRYDPKRKVVRRAAL